MGERKGRIAAVGWWGSEAVIVDAWEDLVAHVETELAELALFDEHAVLALALPGCGADAFAPGELVWGEVVWVVYGAWGGG